MRLGPAICARAGAADPRSRDGKIVRGHPILPEFALGLTRYFDEIQTFWEAGDHAAAEARFQSELPFVLWAMQSLDFSVATAKEELRRRGVIANARQLAPSSALDSISQAQLARFIDQRLASNPV